MEGWLLSFILASVSSLLWTALPTPLFTTIYFTFSLLLLTRLSNHSLSTWGSGFFAGLVWISSVGHWHQYWQLQVDDFNQTVLIEGKVESLIASNDRVVPSDLTDKRFNVEIHAMDGKSMRMSPYSFRLSWHEPRWALKQGQKVQLLVKVKPAHGLANEGGFNYQQWLFSQKIQATGYVKKSELNNVILATPSVRQEILDSILSFELSEGRWIAALSLGYRGLLDKDDWRKLQVTGTSHLVAISGLHMAVVATISYLSSLALLSFMIWCRLLKVRFITHKSALIISLIVCLFYAYLAGFSIPTIRAWTAMAVVVVLMLLNQSWSKTKSFLVLVFVIMLLYPFSLYGISLWLSFSAVIIILYSLWRFPVHTQNNHFYQKWLSAAQMQLILSLFMLPIVVWQFSILSISAPLINLIAVPLVTLLLVPMCVVSSFAVLVSPSIAEYGFILANWLIRYSIEALDYLAQMPLSYTQITIPFIYVWGCLFVFLSLVFLPRLPVPRYLTYIWLLPLLSSFVKKPNDEWKVEVLDVGQGLSVLITREQHAILYDTGPSFPSGFNTAEAVILPLLQSRGINSLDLLIISHKDNDHAGGVNMLKSAIDIKQMISSEDYCFSGWQRKWLGLNMEALWPMTAMSADENEASCVIKISDDEHSVLLTGDIGKQQERKLVTRYNEQLHAKVLIAPHHGSNSSSSAIFINKVSPTYVVFSQGFLNRWSFPRKEVIQRYQDQQVSMLSTSKNGQITFIFKPSNIEVKRFRQDTYPYWYANHLD